MTLEELLINKGVIDKDWNFLESGDEFGDEYKHLYRLTGCKYYSLYVICLMLLATERFAKKINSCDYVINKNWFRIKGLHEKQIYPASYAKDTAMIMLMYIDEKDWAKLVGKMMKERIFI